MAAQNRTKKAISLLEQKSKELGDLIKVEVFRNWVSYQYRFRKWCSETEDILIKIFGSASREVERFREVVRPQTIRGTRTQITERLKIAMFRALAELDAISASIKQYGITETLEVVVSPQIFIAHGGRTAARDKLKDFLVALGVIPMIVEEQPSEGRSKGKNVEYYLKQCDCAVILATRGDIDGRTGEFIPRGNILIEVGRSLELFPDRMIYLLEEEAKFPTNIDEKVWERFSEGCVDKALIKVAKELRAFGLIKAMKH